MSVQGGVYRIHVGVCVFLCVRVIMIMIITPKKKNSVRVEYIGFRREHSPCRSSPPPSTLAEQILTEHILSAPQMREGVTGCLQVLLT
jgi:hypothetical protein